MTEDEALTSANDGTGAGPLGPGAGDDAGEETCGTCGRRLPRRTAGRAGPSRRYCRAEHTWWEIDGKRVSCAEANRAAAVAAAVFGPADDASRAAPDLVALREGLDSVTAPLDQYVATITALREQIDAVRTALIDEVSAARSDVRQAQSDLAEARNQQEIATERAQHAKDAAAEADQRATAAERSAVVAEAQAESAVAERLRAEGAASALSQELGDARERLAAVTDSRDETARHLAASVAAQESDRATLAATQQALAEATARADRIVGEHRRELEATRERYDGMLAQQRRDAETARETTASHHAKDLADLHQRLGALTHRVDNSAAVLDRVRTTVSDLLASPERSGESVLRELIREIPELGLAPRFRVNLAKRSRPMTNPHDGSSRESE